MSIKRVFIVGWYGTETVGDKAILGGILSNYECSPVKIIIASLYPFVTRQTLREIGIKADVVPTHSLLFVKYSAISDEVIMGGGPLMDLEELSVPLLAFSIAKRFHRKRIVWGCGLGPLTQSKYLEATKRILLLASEIKLRDSASVNWAQKLTSRTDIVVIDDPAKEYVLSRRLVLSRNIKPSSDILACFLRNWPRQYAAAYALEEYVQTKNKFESNLAERLVAACREYNLKPVFYAMHSFVVGNDDREFNRNFISNYLSDLNVDYEAKPVSVDEIIDAMLGAKFSICMRFHSVLFAHTLRIKFLAIDYTSGGKIKGFLADNNSLHRRVAIQDLANGLFDSWNFIIKKALDENSPN